jgi:hypothetical protein
MIWEGPEDTSDAYSDPTDIPMAPPPPVVESVRRPALAPPTGARPPAPTPPPVAPPPPPVLPPVPGKAPPAVLADPAIYPDAETQSRLWAPKALNEEQERALTRIFQDIKSG